VSTDQSFTVPAGGAFTIAGHGFGHGHGLSQYGAEGAALQGLHYRKILAFYYPGTTMHMASADATISVLISEDTTRDLQVLAQSGLSVTDESTGTTYALPAISGATRWRLNVSKGRTVVGYYTTAWHRYHPGGLAALGGDGEFAAPSGILTLVTPSGQEQLRGVLRAASPSPGSTDRETVNIVPLDAYVQGVVAREMPASWETPALKAQAVAARTYALFEASESDGRPYDICDTSACQVYGGVAAEQTSTDAAVTATAGEYLAYGGAPAFTQFASSDGGWTSAGSQSYLPHKADPYDDYSANPVHSWSLQAKASVLQQRYPKIGSLRTIVITQREGGGQWKGRVLGLTLIGAKGSVKITGTDMEAAYGLRSTWFTVR
jgi:SpoIID/LytB domain protein